MKGKMTEWGVGPKLVRIFLPYLLLTLALQLMYPSTFSFIRSDSVLFLSLGLLLVIIGLGLWGSGARTIAKAFREGELLTAGPYKIVRHPMYSGLLIFVSTGIAIAMHSWIMLTVPLVGYIAFKIIIKDEENYLREKFGQRYLDYCSKVNALIPFPRLK